MSDTLTNATTTGEAPWPELQEADLDVETLAALFRDLAALARVDAVRLKGGRSRHADDGTVTLDDGFNALRAGLVTGVQIDYHLDGEHWIDTLVDSHGHIRLVRLRVI